MYARRGSGKHVGPYSDVTFGVWKRQANGEDRLASVGAAEIDGTDEELARFDTFVREHTQERFGPTRAVTANQEEGLLLEIMFEGVDRSARHKSGLVLRHPRIKRIRWNKPCQEADRFETLEALLST